jgi:hypothetical protein
VRGNPLDDVRVLEDVPWVIAGRQGRGRTP